jgi:hypothetical protein
MVMKKLIGFLILINLIASAQAQNSLGQTLQIYTHFKSILGKPSWLLIVRDVNTGQVSPYLFDLKHNNNFWVAFTYGHTYRVTASVLKFGAYAEIKNFCGLEDGILSGQSMYITLSGKLSPDPTSSKCYVMKYNDTLFTIVNQENNNAP